MSKGKVGVIGAGVIGLSWSAAFAASGYNVVVSDPRDDLQDALDKFIPMFVPQVPGFDGDVAEAVARVKPASSLANAVEGAVAVQENGPETPDFKQTIFAQLEEVAPTDCLFLSSSSGIPPAVQGEKLKDPNRIVIGHPFNPPHILPLVEVVGSENTPEDLVNRTLGFYNDLGKKAVRLHKAVPGFVANRLQFVLVDEAVRLVEQGVVSVKELDEIVEASLGIRWASIGPLLAGNFGGGPGGLRHILEHVFSALAKGMGREVYSSELVEKLGQQCDEAYPQDKLGQLAAVRDARQSAIIADHQKHPLNT
ncbi:3-hydroxyacyl-CoA dehydrogenase NAD-binding domain-containing protein [Fuerstiella marisgermanici]|uniref:L-carnitine dehydrogenase n=1 Tax=Fuerstiella marisgermanici TaxID=1891926 RepID=A0A1P8WC39_9PLAN|nr:3-hydroxyacyl-CoA dehydrogenase NAD-binding domain-containing protein [Fuerstiella marisgermanici]APZ91602.1 L-carnitine dehydrogenase [Fuerstiella marisgermanici]